MTDGEIQFRAGEGGLGIGSVTAKRGTGQNGGVLHLR